jgi:hypothetical protein
LQARVVSRIGATEIVACRTAEKQQDNSLFFARPTVAGLAETAADTENGYRYTDSRCCLLFRGPGIGEYQSLDPDRSLPHAREPAALPTEALALLSAETSSTQDFRRERDPLLFFRTPLCLRWPKSWHGPRGMD